jgi:hypothetical protein
MDFGCYVDISNKCETSLMLHEARIIGKGSWKVEPPSNIQAASSYEFALKDALGHTGTDGVVDYQLNFPKEGGVFLRLRFACPSKLGSKNTFTAESSDETIMKVEKDGPTEGHPMHGKDLPSKFLLPILSVI